MFHDTLALVMKVERILLVEPNYKNKYPPIGLMKIATYFKTKGDFVEFHKGLLPQSETTTFDKVFITTLFTFDFDMCIQTIRYYIAIVGIENVYVGGIAATIMPRKFTEEVLGLNVITGQLISSSALGYSDHVNIDLLELDYDILWDVSYNYQAADSYFIYTSRGCPRKCSFCAVKTLEPNFYDCNNIAEQIENVNARFGIKKDLLIMDNNILYSKQFSETVDLLVGLGFGVDNNEIKKNNHMKYYLKSLDERSETGKKYRELLVRIKKTFSNINFVRIKKEDKEIIKNIINVINEKPDDYIAKYLLDNRDIVVDFYERYAFHKITRYVDFNQGLDARLFTEEKAEKMANLAVKPCRIAFDKLKLRDEYFTAMEFAIQHGIKYFSNYLLYNFEDRPEELWLRLSQNIQFVKKHREQGVSLFSFPMKYASIAHTNRDFIGEFWNKKYLRALNVILNVTSGVVAKEEDFFVRAFGHSPDEFIEILTMPDNFIRFRDFFDGNGFIELWRRRYRQLSSQDKEDLIIILGKLPDVLRGAEFGCSESVKQILGFYSISKKKVEENPLYYSNLVKKCNTLELGAAL